MGRSTDACKWLDENGGTLEEAASKFGITKQAVHQKWRQIFGGSPTPYASGIAGRDEQIVTLARDGRTVKQIAAETSAAETVVRSVCYRAGITPGNCSKNRPWDAAVEQIRSGRMFADVAAEYGVSVGRLGKICAERGIPSTAPSGVINRDGRVARAVARVDFGASVPAAAAAERCSPNSVYRALKVRRQRRRITRASVASAAGTPLPPAPR